MGVVSISLPEETTRILDEIIEEGGFKGRSDVVKAAINNLSLEQKQQKKLKGRLNGLLILVHDEIYESAFSNARHKFEDLIKTLIHNQLGNGKCLEIFLLEGEAKKVKELLITCRATKKAEYIKLITT